MVFQGGAARSTNLTRKTTTSKSASATRKTAAGQSEGRRRGSSGTPDSKLLALAVAGAALEHKALNVEIIDVRGKVDYSDYVVIMSGRSDRQVAALARNIEATLQEQGQRCLGVEGLPHASWLLMDYADVIVHIFHEDTRGYYDLETLWIDAARVSVE